MFPDTVPSNSDYAVSINTQPIGQTCAVESGNGKVKIANINSVKVVCNPNTYKVIVTATGVTRPGLSLRNNGADNLTIDANGEYTFGVSVAYMSNYDLAIVNSPAGLYCSLSQSKGVVGATDINGVKITVNCNVNFFKVNVSVSGVTGAGMVLQNNGGDNLPINANGNYIFTTAVADLSNYSVSVLKPPARPNQECSISSNGTGQLAGANVSVSISCKLQVLFVGNDGSTGYELYKTDGTAAGTSQIKDINTNTDSNPSDFVDVNGVIYFAASDGGTGMELWKTTGVALGTALVKDINSGADSSYPSNLTKVGGLLFFTAQGNIGQELWKYDPSTAILTGVDVNPGLTNSTPNSSSPRNLVAVGGVLYFTATSATNGNELWKYDPAIAPPLQVIDIVTGAVGSNPNYLTLVGTSKLYFSAYTAASGDELWQLDPAAATPLPTIVAELVATTGSSYPSNLKAMGSYLYFSATTAANGYELYRYDGSAAPVLIDINGGAGSSYPGQFEVAGSTLYLSADNGSSGRELFKCVATTCSLVVDIWQGMNGTYPNSSSPSNITAVGSVVYFTANDGANGNELWKYDGSATLIDINTGAVGGAPNSSSPRDLVVLNYNTLVFSAYDSAQGQELWAYNGSALAKINDIVPGVPSGYPQNLFVTSLNNKVYFSASDGQHGRELWSTDGTVGNTAMVADIGQKGGDSLYYSRGGKGGVSRCSRGGTGYVATVNGITYFSAYDGISNELWRTDGIQAGTFIVKRLNTVNANGSNPSNFAVLGDTVYFSADDGVSGVELWSTQGTNASTKRVRDINPGLNGSCPSNLTVVGNVLYFTANDGTLGTELWRTTNTSAGAELAYDIYEGAYGSYPSYLTAVGNMLYFSANGYSSTTGEVGTELYRYDPSATGAAALTLYDIFPGTSGTAPNIYPNSSSPYYLTAVGTSLYFTAYDSTHGSELWKLSGGITSVIEIVAGATSSYPSQMTALGNTLYFSATGSNGSELFKYDGNTLTFDDLYPGLTNTYQNSSYPGQFTVLGNNLFFTANDGSNGNELWKVGVSSAPVMVPNINAGADSSSPTALRAVGDKLFFVADDGSTGMELWVWDGVAPTRVKDINSGAATGAADIFPQ